MEEAKKNITQNAKEAAQEWAKSLVKELLEQEEVEDYMYEFRWEVAHENSLQCILRLYPLWAALAYCDKEALEALYRKGYRYIHKLGKDVVVIETRHFDMSIEEAVSEEAWVVRFIPLLIKRTIEEDRYPVMLLNEYDQVERQLKGKIRQELFRQLEDEYDAQKDNGVKQEAFFNRMQDLFPAIYENWMKATVRELSFCIGKRVEAWGKYLEKYKEIHKDNTKRIRELEEYLEPYLKKQK